ncbi:MAG: CRISPR system precrRNA processing endoribonuclease RAMP protein Cas6 [Deltaproteobacteria bacterium]|nr:CRISPR system precrRNA processing endoribonuclease RAMP protein Cas6 [Deltaproteobacteria bacterium]
METSLKNFNFCVYRLTLEAVEKIELARLNKGITLRGAFGSIFRRLVCHDLNTRCHHCPMHGSCPYGFIFTPMVPPEAKRLRLNRDIPRPFVIRPPVDGKNIYRPGDRLRFELVVVGKAQDFLPYFIVTFEELGRQGIGIRRGRFSMRKLEVLRPDGAWDEVFRSDDRMVRPPEKPLSYNLLFGTEKPPEPGKLRIRFLTPVLIKEGGRWVRPNFAPLVKRLRDRINSLSYFYCNETLEMNFRLFGDMAEKVRTIYNDLRWVEEKRVSKHKGLNHLLKGYVGKVEFEGNLVAFMPFLRIGEFIHVGKATAFGQGWYKID